MNNFKDMFLNKKNNNSKLYEFKDDYEYEYIEEDQSLDYEDLLRNLGYKIINKSFEKKNIIIELNKPIEDFNKKKLKKYKHEINGKIIKFFN